MGDLHPSLLREDQAGPAWSPPPGSFPPCPVEAPGQLLLGSDSAPHSSAGMEAGPCEELPVGSPFLRERLWAIQKGRPLLATCVYKFCADHLYVMEGASWYFLGGILGRKEAGCWVRGGHRKRIPPDAPAVGLPRAT